MRPKWQIKIRKKSKEKSKSKYKVCFLLTLKKFQHQAAHDIPDPQEAYVP